MTTSGRGLSSSRLTTEAKPPDAAATEDVSPPAGRILRRPAANEMDSGIVSASEARLARPSKPAVSPAALRRIKTSTTSPITGCSASAPWRASDRLATTTARTASKQAIILETPQLT